ncbi:PRC-barrel domain-containing protein [Arenibaculum pallidiluteum]|uniref:PRC-barrel domain-containing protein n=1 Tax=Arenibaculum pallidiluteum TaxID=2812559 RepID=UPI001A9642F4|nr:PRC-barrel domain-containing protein [Arenibaculum pallidiluteum]
MRLALIGTVSLAAVIAAGAAVAQSSTAPAPMAPEAAPTNGSAAGQPAGNREGVSADDMIGRTVYSESGQDLGSVTDVIIDPDSKQIRRLVIGSGGFLGIGKKNVAVEVDRVQVRPQEGITVSGLTQETIRDMPEYDPDSSTVSLDRPAPRDPAPGAGAGPAGTGMPSPSGAAPAPDMGRTTGQPPPAAE